MADNLHGPIAAYSGHRGEAEMLAEDYMISLVAKHTEKEITIDDGMTKVCRFDHRDPDEIFETGFNCRVQGKQPDEEYFDLKHHVIQGVVLAENPPHAFISTSLDPNFSDETGFLYEIEAPGGIDVATVFGDDYVHSSEKEVAFIGRIAPEFICQCSHRISSSTEKDRKIYANPIFWGLSKG